MNKLNNLSTLKKKILSDPESKLLYKQLAFEDQLVRALIDQRINKNLTQKQLAEIIGTKQSSISRLESGNSNPSLQFLSKIINALDLKIKFSVLT